MGASPALVYGLAGRGAKSSSALFGAETKFASKESTFSPTLIPLRKGVTALDIRDVKGAIGENYVFPLDKFGR